MHKSEKTQEERLARAALLESLKKCSEMDPEGGHIAADKALLRYIDDLEVTKAFNSQSWWYA